MKLHFEAKNKSHQFSSDREAAVSINIGEVAPTITSITKEKLGYCLKIDASGSLSVHGFKREHLIGIQKNIEEALKKE
ncbi:MAG: hypothetical protein Q7K26_00995 [bacterium]|nr:hypothetical protein [bacterium]